MSPAAELARQVLAKERQIERLRGEQARLAGALAGSMRPTTGRIASYAAGLFNLELDDVVGPRRDNLAVYARDAVVWVTRQMRPNISTPALGRALGGRDHTTILAALRRIEFRRAQDADFRTDSDALLAAFTTPATEMHDA